MTEAEWLACSEPMALLRQLGADRCGRKYQLYLIAGCRHISHLFHHSWSLEAVEIMERDADGLASQDETGKANWIAESPTFGCDFSPEWYERHPEERTKLPRLVELGVIAEPFLSGGEWQIDESIRDRVRKAAELAYLTTLSAELNPRHFQLVEREIRELQNDWPDRWLVDCIFGNPFRPVSFDSRWRSETVVSLASAIYAERAFDRMPILADALEDAGCDHADILAHCRGDGPHVRGCWVVDLILGKS